jgi:Zn-finger nucleic acid-binding protein
MNFGGSSGIIVDVCKAHGTWLDTGELPRVLEFVRGHGLGQKRRTAGVPELSTENQAALRRAEALMQYEVLSEQQRAAHVIETFDDVVHMLFGSSSYGQW